MAEFISNYGVWLVAAFIALESIGIPLPAEAALIAAGFFAARTHGIDIYSLIAAGIIAAILGEVIGFWIGKSFGHRLLVRYGARLGFTERRIRIGQWLFERYGGRFVFIARFLPFLRNIAAVLAGTNSMAQHSFYFASATAAATWVIGYGLAAYSFGEAFANLASPAAVVLGLAATLIVLATPVLILRYEGSLLTKAEREFPSRSESERQGRCGILPAGGGSHAALQFKGAALEQGKFALGGIGAAAINVVNHSERYPRRGLEPRSVCQKRGGTNVGVIAARIDKNRALLMAALRVHRAEDTIKSSNIMQSWLEEMIAAIAKFCGVIQVADIQRANVSNIGLLGASLGADVSVMTRTGIIDPPATIDRPMSNEVVAKLYAGLENAMREWREDLCHVALRIRAREEGTLDPGTLLEAQIKRKQEKGQDERDIAASTPGIPRTKRQQEKVKKERIDE